MVGARDGARYGEGEAGGRGERKRKAGKRESGKLGEAGRQRETIEVVAELTTSMALGNRGPSTFRSKASGWVVVSLVRAGGPGVACYGQARLCSERTTTGVTFDRGVGGIASYLSADLFGHDREASFFRSLIYESAGWTTGPCLVLISPVWPYCWAGDSDLGRKSVGLYTTGRVLVCAHKRVVGNGARWIWGWDSRHKIILENRASWAGGLQKCAHGLRL